MTTFADYMAKGRFLQTLRVHHGAQVVTTVATPTLLRVRVPTPNHPTHTARYLCVNCAVEHYGVELADAQVHDASRWQSFRACDQCGTKTR